MQPDTTESQVIGRQSKLARETQRILRLLAEFIAFWNADDFQHGQQVARAMLRLAFPEEAEEWYWAGLLHDLGKIALPPHVVFGRGALSPAERRMMQQHPLLGARLLKKEGAPRTVVLGAQLHHARWDGSGYPSDWSGLRIPRVARALAIADVYHALTSERPYRRAYAPQQARLEIERMAGVHFDPEMVLQFFKRREAVHARRERVDLHSAYGETTHGPKRH